MVRLWHALPTTYRRIRVRLRRGQSFANLWARYVPAERSRIIAAHIADAGLGVV